MASGTTLRRETEAAARSRSYLSRYILLALLVAIAVLYQVGAVRAALSHVPANVPKFAPGAGSSALVLVDAKAAAAGLRQGDILLAINGHPYFGTQVLYDAVLHARTGESIAVTVRSPQPGSPERTVLLPVTQPNFASSRQRVTLAVTVFMAAFCLVLGSWVVAVRPGDPLAWLLLGLMFSFCQLFSASPGIEGWGPAFAKLTFAYSLILGITWPAFMFLFGFYFPEPLPLFRRRDTWWRQLPWIVLLPYLVISLGLIPASLIELTNTAALAPYSGILHLFEVMLDVYVFGLVSGFFGLIFTKSYKALSPDSRRRLRLLYWGATAALTPALLYGLALWLEPNAGFSDWAQPIVGLMLLVFPATLAYVIVVQRAMDVRVVVRQGLQYAVARNGVRTLQVLAIFVVTMTALALIGRSQDRPYQKVVVIALGLLAIFTIGRLAQKAGAWIDRRFFREAYDAEQVLSELSDGVRSMVEVRSLIATVAERISETLHIPRVTVLLGGGGPYRPAYALGYGAPPDIAFLPGAGTVKVLQRQNEPARVYLDDPHSWLYREPEVTDDDRSKLTQLDAELLLPLSARDKLLGFISLGPKRSDEPYSRTDLRLLKSVAAQTGLALENAHLITAIAEEVAQRERLNSELEIARDVQERLFPQKLAPVPGIDYAGACRPALGVGGDYYDFLALPGGKLGIAIGDVSGKGIAAALTMASLQASLRSEATRAPDDLAALMCNVNRLLHEALASNRYATFFYGQYDPQSHQLTYVNAGHNAPILFHRSGGQWQLVRLDTGGTVVGLLDSFPYQQGTVPIAAGDVLIAFTDGISEAMNEAQDEFGEERLIETVEGCASLSPAEIITRIMQSADAFAAGAKQNDDMTLVALCARCDSNPAQN